jgi:hypothetical protein
LDTPRTTPFRSSTMRPAVLAILEHVRREVFVSRGHRGTASAAAGWRVELLFYLGEAARPDLYRLVSTQSILRLRAHTIHTTPIISYSMMAGVDCLSVWPGALSFAKSSRFRKTFAPASLIALSLRLAPWQPAHHRAPPRAEHMFLAIESPTH